MAHRAPARALALVVVLALAALLGGCGDGGGGGSPAGPSEPGAARTITNAAGDECSAREPDPPAQPATYGAPPPMAIDPAATYRARIETSCGTIVIALDAGLAPVAVNNFVFLAREGFYDGLTFHRAIPDYIIQTGDPEGDGRGGPGYTFADELPDDGYPTGSVAMANAGPDTNGSQFFIVTGTAPLPNSFTRFGRVVRGLDVARAIEGFANTSGDPGDPEAARPTETLYIHRVTITER